MGCAHLVFLFGRFSNALFFSSKRFKVIQYLVNRYCVREQVLRYNYLFFQRNIILLCVVSCHVTKDQTIILFLILMLLQCTRAGWELFKLDGLFFDVVSCDVIGNCLSFWCSAGLALHLQVNWRVNHVLGTFVFIHLICFCGRIANDSHSCVAFLALCCCRSLSMF